MKLIVNPHKIEIIKEPVNEREINISKCDFIFDDEITNNYVKEAYFTFKGDTYKQIIVNDECDFPSEVLTKKGTVEIGVVAYLVENETEIKRYNPSPAYFNTWAGSLKDHVENSEPITPSEMEQFEQALNDGLNEVANVDIDATETLSGATITITNRQGQSKTVDILNGKDGADGKDGKDGTKGDKGADAEINGVNTLTIEAGTNITLDQEGSTLTINSTGGGTSNYADLINKPQINSVELNGNKTLSDLGIQPAGNYALSSEIPTKTSELTNDSGFITSYTETDPTVPSYVKGITQQNITDWNDKQDELVSGTNIKTINNESILGSGNIAISSGATYTAGTNIEITNADVINNTIPFEGTSGNGFVVGRKKTNTTINTSAIGVGKSINASGLQTVVIGNNATGSNQMSVTIGEYATVDSSSGIAIGRGAETHGGSSIVIGAGAVTYQSSSIALGRDANARQSNLFEIGSSSYPINKVQIYTSNGDKELATQDYVDTAIANAITNTLGGSF